MMHMKARMAIIPPVSILVIVECPSEYNLTNGEVSFGDFLFQSLLSWNVLLNEHTEKPRWTARILFQSLLSWNVLLNCRPLDVVDRAIEFQSLLSWNVLLNHAAVT